MTKSVEQLVGDGIGEVGERLDEIGREMEHGPLGRAVYVGGLVSSTLLFVGGMLAWGAVISLLGAVGIALSLHGLRQNDYRERALQDCT